MLNYIHHPEFVEIMKWGVARVYDDVTEDLPRMSGVIQCWMKDLAGSPEPADYFLQPVTFPLMLLPWWVERQLMGDFDPNFQTDLVTSNASLHYSIRMVENALENHASSETRLLPVASYFVDRFHSIYQEFFPRSDPFWDYFRITWSESADVITAGAHLGEVDRDTFINLASRKVVAAKIGVAAVCYRYHRPGWLPLWSRWINTFGAWHTFRQELFSWRQDLKAGNPTYLLSEAVRRKQPDESIEGWLTRQGQDWALAQLDRWMEDLEHMTFVPPETTAYLEYREQELYDHRAAMLPASDPVDRLSRKDTHA